MTYNARLNALLRASVTSNYYRNGPPTWIVSYGEAWQRLSQTNEEAETQRDADVKPSGDLGSAWSFCIDLDDRSCRSRCVSEMPRLLSIGLAAGGRWQSLVPYP